jgi:hypothetical protein
VVSGPDVVRFSKTGIFGVTVIVFSFLRKGNIVLIGVLITSARSYLNTYTIYTKNEFDLFYTFTNTLKDYDRKKGKL